MRKKILTFFLFSILFTALTNTYAETNSSSSVNNQANIQKDSYKFPDFYKGFYLNVYSARSMDRLSVFIEKASKNKINAVVMDVQRGSSENCGISPEIVAYCIKNGVHPIARVVVFEDGLSKYPVPEELINNRLNVAEQSCKNGFKEIQFDYIRFNDYRVSKKLSNQEKYDYIEGFLKKARVRLSKYNVKIAADIFGRIPLNQDDGIGQKMEMFDRAVDVICPMAYPSHYTWSNNLMANPYHTVFITSKNAKERSKKAEIVTYIQAFQMKIGKSNLTFEKYIEEQVKAVHDAGVKGYILWNASQNYDAAYRAMNNYYKSAQEARNTVNKNKKSS